MNKGLTLAFAKSVGGRGRGFSLTDKIKQDRERGFNNLLGNTNSILHLMGKTQKNLGQSQQKNI